MKKLLFILIMFVSLFANAQTQSLLVDSLHAGKNATSKAAFTGKVWLKNFNGNRPITNGVTGQHGVNPSTNELVSFLNAVFYPSQPPTASLSGGTNLELRSVGTAGPYTLNWVAGRQAATDQINTVTITSTAGQNFPLSFSQPSAPGIVSGSQNVFFTANTNITFTNTVLTADGKTATASTSFNYLPKRYWGRTANVAASAAEILASAGGNNALSNSKSGTFSITASGSNRVFIAYPSSLGDLTSIVVGGLESLASFTKTVTSLTNASGYTQNYNVYTSNNATGGDLTANTQ